MVTSMTDRSYVRYEDKHLWERIPPGEADDIEACADLINEMQRAVYNKARHAYTGTHCRTQGIIHGTLTTEPNLPPHLRQSLFAEERSYPFAARYSTETQDPGIDDRIPQPRGLALKLFSVPGTMFPDTPGTDLPTQDIEFNSTPAIELSDARTTREILTLRRKHANNPQTELDKDLSQRPDADLQKARDQVPNTPLQGLTWYSQTAYRFGDLICKYRLVPDTAAQTAAAAEQEISSSPSDDDGTADLGPTAHSGRLSAFHLAHAARWLFQVQLLSDPARQSVEDGGAPWDESQFPWQTVARASAPRQQSWDYGLKAFWEDRMRLDPWHGLLSLEPVGGANRLRRVVYPRSSGLRRALNGYEGGKGEVHVRALGEVLAQRSGVEEGGKRTDN